MSEQSTGTSGVSTRKLSRTRGALSGVLLIVLGAWGAIAPFIGPSIHFAYRGGASWQWTAVRGWFEVLPGAVAVLGGLLLLMGTSRVVTTVGAWLGIVAGAWFVIGPPLSPALLAGTVPAPVGSNTLLVAVKSLAYFYLLGVVIVFLASAAFGRLSVVTVRDVRVAERREAARLEAEQRAEREAAERAAADREETHRELWAPQPDDNDTAERAAVERAAADRDAANRASAEEYAGRTHANGAHDTATEPGYGQQTSQQVYDQQSGYDQRAGYGQQSGYDRQASYDQSGSGRHDAETTSPGAGYRPPPSTPAE